MSLKYPVEIENQEVDKNNGEISIIQEPAQDSSYRPVVGEHKNK